MKKSYLYVILLGFLIFSFAFAGDLKKSLSNAQALQQEGKVKEAIGLLETLIENHPNSSDAYLILGSAYGELSRISSEEGDYMTAMQGVTKAFDSFSKSIELAPNSVNAHFYYGVYGINVPDFFGKLESGVEHLEVAKKLYEKHPKDTDEGMASALYRFLGEGYQKQSRLSEAKTEFQKVLKLSPHGEHADAAQINLKELKDIQPQIEKKPDKIEQSPESVESLIKLGKSYMQENDPIKAKETFKKATQMDPNHAEAQLLLVEAIGMDTMTGYDERIYDDQDTRTHLAFEVVNEMEKAIKLDPENQRLKLTYATACIYMPFFIGKMDKGLAILEDMIADENLSDSLKTEALYSLGFGYRKKGTAIWMKLVTKHPKADQNRMIYNEFGLREYGQEKTMVKGDKVIVTFHMGFKDELEPQTAVWIENEKGNHVKTLYISGFSGYAKEKQVVLPHFAKQTLFETDGTTGASIDWGKHSYSWDLTDHEGKKVQKGKYTVKVEISWWPSMKYGLASADIEIGKKTAKMVVSKEPFIPMLKVKYIKD